MFTMLLQNFLPKNWPLDILFVGNINKYLIIMHLSCINHNNIINKPFSPKKGRINTLNMCLDIHAKFRGDQPLWGRDLEGGGQNLLSKSPVKIGLRFGNGSPLEGAMYIKSIVKQSRGTLKIFFSSNFLQILMVSDKTIYKACRIHNTL